MSFTTRQGRAFYKRPLAVLGATALTVGAFGPAAQADNHVQSIDPACEGWAEPFGFEDIQNETQAYQDAINCLAWYGITEGRNPTTYAPDTDVQRYEMALFISRTIGYMEDASADIDVVDPGDADDAGFEDIDGLDGDQQDAIAQLVELDIVRGKNADEFAPYEPITRRDMARFIDRLVDNVVDGSADADVYEPDYTDLFVDVPQDLPGAEDIYSLRAEGIVEGESGNRYLPYASVDRKDMAFYVMRTVADLVDKDYIDALPVTNQTYAVTQGAATNVASASDSNSGAREYEVTGLDPTMTYDVALFEAGNVTVDEYGVVTFEAASGIAVPGTPNAVIEQVNGLGIVPEAAVEAQPDADGTLTFLVDAVQATSVVPVVWLDGEATAGTGNETGDNALDLDANGAPTEAFGVGGQKTWTAPEAADGIIEAAEVASVDKAANSFVLGTGTAARTYFYSAEDTFQFAGDGGTTRVSQAQFEAQLSRGDTVAGTYDAAGGDDSDGPSTFTLTNEAPDAPEQVTATPTSQTTVDVTFTDKSVDSYRVYRYTVPAEAAPTQAQAWAAGDFALIGTVQEDAETVVDNAFADTGLTPGATYWYAVTTVLDGDESDDVRFAEATTPETIATITNAELTYDDVQLGALDDTDQFEITFSENVTLDESATDPVPYVDVTVQDADGDVALIRVYVEGAAVPDEGDRDPDVSYASVVNDVWGDSADDPETLTIEMVTDAIDRNAAGNGNVTYPVTITDIDGLYDRESGGNTIPVTVDGADDVVIDDEGNVSDTPFTPPAI